MRKRMPVIALSALCLMTGISLAAQGIAPENELRRETVKKWQDMGFGMFIHWEGSSVLHGKWQDKEKNMDLWGEWLMKRARIPIKEYEEAVKPFNPVNFNADQWVKLAKEAGMKYMVITAKHHDGFAMYHSNASKYNIVDHCGVKFDPMKKLSEACKKHGLKFGFYYSHRVDWHEPGAGGKNPEAFTKYWSSKVIPQVEELTTQYGPLGTMWFDLGCGDKEKVDALRKQVLKNQPAVMINSRIGSGKSDYRSLKDRQVPAVPVASPSETCMTLCEHWAYYPQDDFYKSAEDVVRMLVAIRSRGANLLLNIGPNEKGKIPLRETVILKRVGNWIKVNGDSIYGVSPTIFPPLPWGESTRKDNKLYLHLFKLPTDGTLFVPGLKTDVAKAYFLGAPQIDAVTVEKTALGYNLKLNADNIPVEALSPYDTVLVLECAGTPEADKTYCLDHDFDNVFSTAYAVRNGNIKTTYTRESTIELDPVIKGADYVFNARGFSTADDSLTWSFNNDRRDGFYVIVNYSLPPGSPDAEMVIEINGQKIEAKLPPTENGILKWKYRKRYVGTAVVDKCTGKELTFSVKNASKICLESVELKPSHIYPPY